MSYSLAQVTQKKLGAIRQEFLNQASGPHSPQNRPVDALYYYPTQQLVKHDGSLKQHFVIQTPLKSDQLAQAKQNQKRLTGAYIIQTNCPASPQSPMPISTPPSKSDTLHFSSSSDDAQQRAADISRAVDKVYDLIRERLVQKHPEVQHQKYFHLGAVCKEDIHNALDGHASGMCARFDMKTLDHVAVGILAQIGYAMHNCEACGMVFGDAQALKKHREIRFREPFVCLEDGCGRHLCSVEAVRLHTSLIHGKDAATAKSVRKQWEESGLEVPVLQTSTQTREEFPCDIAGCNRSFKTARGLRVHKLRGHKTK